MLMKMSLQRKPVEAEASASTGINTKARRSLREDTADLAAFEQRAKEPNLDFEAVLKDMKRRCKV